MLRRLAFDRAGRRGASCAPQCDNHRHNHRRAPPALLHARSGRDLLAPRCNLQKQLVCGNRCVNFLVDPNNWQAPHACCAFNFCLPAWRPPLPAVLHPALLSTAHAPA